jgi:uncharacterized protein (UPF0248 family)
MREILLNILFGKVIDYHRVLRVLQGLQEQVVLRDLKVLKGL